MSLRARGRDEDTAELQPAFAPDCPSCRPPGPEQFGLPHAKVLAWVGSPAARERRTVLMPLALATDSQEGLDPEAVAQTLFLCLEREFDLTSYH